MTAQPVFQAKRMTSRDYCQRIQAFETVADAKEAAAQLLAKTQKEIENQRATLHEELAQMHEDAMARAKSEVEAYVTAEKPRQMEKALQDTLALSRAIQRAFDASEDWLTELVSTTVRRILSALPPDQLDLELVRSAVKESGARWNLELHVEQARHAQLERVIRSVGSELECIENVVARQDLKPGQMLLLSAGGITDLTVDVQLGLLAGVIQSACQRRNETS